MDWRSFLLGEEKWEFLAETLFRTLIMFLVILTSLRLLGKRGVKQLSVFELGVIIGLGSAAGDPMFYKDVGLLPCILVFAMVVFLYRLITYFIGKSPGFEKFVEGNPTYMVRDGSFVVESIGKEPIAADEIFAALRNRSVTHLGQVWQAIIETNGEVSVFYYPDNEVRYGLPILPHEGEKKTEEITEEAHYSCYHCGHTKVIAPARSHPCPACSKKHWVRAINRKRIV
jgi:uncharacterized membrane protein YcaP (DUF421 family)